MRDQTDYWEFFGFDAGAVAGIDQGVAEYRDELDLMLGVLDSDYARGTLLPGPLLFKLFMMTIDFKFDPDNIQEATANGVLLIKFMMMFSLLLHRETLRRNGEEMPSL